MLGRACAIPARSAETLRRSWAGARCPRVRRRIGASQGNRGRAGRGRPRDRVRPALPGHQARARPASRPRPQRPRRAAAQRAELHQCGRAARAQRSVSRRLSTRTLRRDRSFRTAEDYERLIDGLHPVDWLHARRGSHCRGRDGSARRSCSATATGRPRPLQGHRRRRGRGRPPAAGVIDFAAIVEYLRDTGIGAGSCSRTSAGRARPTRTSATERNGALRRATRWRLAAQAQQRQPQV